MNAQDTSKRAASEPQGSPLPSTTNTVLPTNFVACLCHSLCSLSFVLWTKLYPRGFLPQTIRILSSRCCKQWDKAFHVRIDSLPQQIQLSWTLSDQVLLRSGAISALYTPTQVQNKPLIDRCPWRRECLTSVRVSSLRHLESPGM